MQKPIKKALTLIEVMIVILIIGIIGSVVGYNMKGSLDKAKVFKTEQGAKKLYELALLGLEENPALLTGTDSAADKVRRALNQLGVAGNVATLMQDGWGNPFTNVTLTNGVLRFRSARYEAYCRTHGRDIKYPWNE